MFADTHMHTKLFSEDGIMTIEEAIKQQKDNIIVITEHFDYDYPPPYTFQFDTKAYMDTYLPYRKEHKLLLGIEIGMQPSCVERNYLLAKKENFDQIIASTHIVDGIDIYEAEYWEGKSKKDAHARYLDVMYENICSFTDFDTMSHIDYCARYGPYEEKGLIYEDHAERIDKILRFLADHDKAMEISTRRFGNEKAEKELEQIYTRFYELGGRYVTIGSDAHESKNMFHQFEAARKMVKKIGLTEVYFCRRKRNLVIA